MKVYLIKGEKSEQVIRWEGTLQSFINCHVNEFIGDGDGVRRSLANTKQRDTYYRGWKVLFYGEEEPQSILKEELEEQAEKVMDMFDVVEEDTTENDYKNYKEQFIKCGFNCDQCSAINCKERKKNKRNVLFIPDLHCPFDYVKGIEIAKKIYKENNCTEVVFLGDVVDFLNISEYGRDVDFMGQSEELIKTKEHLKAWHDAFPIAKVCTGNHTMRIKKKFEKANLSLLWMNDFRKMFNLDGWDFQLYHEVGKFIATHGMGQNAKARSKDLHKSVINGHLHSKFEANYDSGLWSIYGGCMVDIDSRAFEYGKFFKLPKLGLVVVKDIDGDALVKMIPIKYDKTNGYNKMNELW